MAKPNRSRSNAHRPPRRTRVLLERAMAIDAELAALYPRPTTELHHANPFELLVATILSAQCTDVRVNQVTPALFEAFPDASALAKATPEELWPFIESCGLYRSKAKNLVATGQALQRDHEGRVPDSRAELEALAGVGRKTANVVLSNAFGQPALAVDTHVGRLARRLGLSKATDPKHVETDLCSLYPEERWFELHHELILHGRRVCNARSPQCDSCSLTPLCPSSET